MLPQRHRTTSEKEKKMEPNFVVAARSVAPAPRREEDLIEEFYDTHAFEGLQRVRRAFGFMSGMCLALLSNVKRRPAPKIVASGRRV
jgi:hypothetical protein